MSVSTCVRSHQLADALGRTIDRRGRLHAVRAGARRSGRILDRDRALHGASRFLAVQHDVCFAHLWIPRQRGEYSVLGVGQDLGIDRFVQG
jgi:hypothetical protein